MFRSEFFGLQPNSLDFDCATEIKNLSLQKASILSMIDNATSLLLALLDAREKKKHD